MPMDPAMTDGDVVLTEPPADGVEASAKRRRLQLCEDVSVLHLFEEVDCLDGEFARTEILSTVQESPVECLFFESYGAP